MVVPKSVDSAATAAAGLLWTAAVADAIVDPVVDDNAEGAVMDVASFGEWCWWW